MTSKEKKKRLESLLVKGTALISFDARKSGLVIPKHLRGQKAVVFKIGRDMVPEIPDLKLTEMGVEATLAFNSVSYWCQVPWEAVLGMCEDERQKSDGGWRLPSGKVIPSYLKVVK